MQDTMQRKIQMRCKVPAYDEVPGDEDAIMPMAAIDAFLETAAGDFPPPRHPERASGLISPRATALRLRDKCWNGFSMVGQRKGRVEQRRGAEPVSRKKKGVAVSRDPFV
jgi:hypothetical protein